MSNNILKKVNSEFRLKPRRLAKLALMTAISVVFSGATAFGDEQEKIEPTPFNAALATVVGQLLPRLHYTTQELNEELSQKWFDQYFASLDRQRRYFLKSDIEEFKEHRDQLHEMLLNGDLSFPFKVYNRYLKRIRERVDFIGNALETSFDFTTDQKIRTDRSEAPWPENKEELDQIWRRHIKNRLINYTIAGQEEPEPEPDPEENKSETMERPHPRGHDGEEKSPEPTEVQERDSETEAEPVVDERSPKERVLEYYQRQLKQFEDFENVEILDTFVNALARIYDPHTNYMAPAREEDFEIDMSLSLEGIGAVLSTDEYGYIKVEEIIPGGPADQDGNLQVGDRIVGVSDDDEMVDVVNMSLRRTVRLIRGPKGSKVRLQVLPAGRGLGAIPMEFELVRDEIELTAQQAQSETSIIKLPSKDDFIKTDEAAADEEHKQEDSSEAAEENDGESANILTVALPSFYADLNAMREGDEDYRRASQDVRKIIADIQEDEEEPLDGVIIDLRYNGGGSLEEAIKVAGLFLPGGPMVQVRSAREDVEVLEEDKTMLYDGPLIVMVNRFSASASEIVAAAIQDYGRGLVIGDSGTYGKGTVQNIYDLNRFFARQPFFKDEEAGSLKFTMAKYYRVDGGSVQKRGVVPDISLPSFTDHLEIGEDELEDALPWNEIEPLIEEDAVEERWRGHLPRLKERSQFRVRENPEFREIEKFSEKYRQIRERETKPLNLEVRKELRKKEMELSDKVREETSRRRRYDQEEEEEKKKRQDPHQAETQRVLADLIWLDRYSKKLP